MSGPDTDPWLHAVIETAVDGIVIIGERGTIWLFNQACERLFGYRAAEVLGQNVRMLMPEPYQSAHDSYLKHYRDTGERRLLGGGRDLEGVRRDGSVFPIHLSIGEIATTEAGRLFVGFIRDISEQRAAEEELREQAERVRSILETVPDALILIDESGSVESFSPAAERLFGWSSDEVRGRNINMLMPQPYREQHDGYLARYRETGERRIIGIGRIVVGLRRDGSTFPMELAVGEVKLSGRRRFTGFVRDLSERQSAEKRLQELQTELLHVSRFSAMGQMASALAHELNQPLTAVINWTVAAKRLAQAGKLTDKTFDFMDKAIEQANRAGQIIRRLRSFIEKGESDRQREDINKVVEEATALALVGGKEAGVHMSLAFTQDLPAVLIDKVQVQQVILNLVRNAIEAMADRPVRELTITTAEDAQGMIEVLVADTGTGLSPEVAAQLFQPFVTTKAKGMGLGLSISRSIIDGHGGRLIGRSNDKGGVTFIFTLPAWTSEEEDLDE
ncbi:MAG TPA: PAS domain S-box protein [Aliidongia sp.]|nr:PAS domain S-box protein [Aliidongia sp.]